MNRQYFSNFNWLFADYVLRIVGSLVVGIWVARYLGPDDYGLLNFAMSFVALFGALGKLSIESVAVREIARFPEKQGEILGCVFRLKLLSSLAAMALVGLAAWLSQGDNLRLLALVAILAVGIVFNAFDAIDIFYQAKVLSKYVVLARTLSFVIFAAVRVGLILGGFPVIWFALAFTLEIAVGTVFLAWVYHRRERGFLHWSWRNDRAAQLLRDGWPIVVTAILIVLHTRVDQVMIGKMLSSHEVGLYSAAVKINDVWMFIPVLMTQTLMPAMIQLGDRSPELFQQRLMQFYSAMFWMGATVALLAVMFGSPAIVLLFGREYAQSYPVLVIRTWTGIFIAQGVARSIWLMSENYQVYRLLINLVAVPFNIILNFLLIPVWGVRGAAIASLISIGCSTWIIPLLFRPMRGSTVDLIKSANPKYLFGGGV